MELLHQVPLATYTTLRLGGLARYFVSAQSVPDLREALTFAKSEGVPRYILGGGSNTLFPDEGFPGMVIHIALQGISYEEASRGDARCIAGAGVVWDTLVEETVGQGMWGLENLSIIPGTVGASPVQNVGAYGVEVAELIDWVEVLNTITHELHILTPAECAFGYRDSIFKRDEGKHLIVTRVAYRLKTHATPRVEYADLVATFADSDIRTLGPGDIRTAVMAIRARKLPDPAHVGTAGSFFKNPIVSTTDITALQNTFDSVPVYPVDDTHAKLSAAWLLDRLGWKGKREGTVGCWPNQPLCLVHYGDGSSQELLMFAQAIQEDVYTNTGITLEPEVCIIRANEG